MNWRQVYWLFVIGICLVVTITLGILYNFNPQEYRFYPRCQFYMLTGLKCPACGMLRAIHCLLHGRIMDAIQFNFFIPIIVIFSLVFLRCRVQNMCIWILFGGFILAWVIIRNFLNI